MVIWLINVGEAPYFDNPTRRPLRMGQTCSALLESGASIVYWTSTFVHAEKRHTHTQTIIDSPRERLCVVRLHSPGYRSHVSLDRVVDQIKAAVEFCRVSRTLAKPDAIICSYPTIELAFAAVHYGRRRRVPVVLDIRDMWPDLVAWCMPERLRPFVQAALLPYHLMARYALTRATAITAITKPFLAWSLNRSAPRKPAFAIHFCYPNTRVGAGEQNLGFWRDRGVVPGKQPIVIFIGTFNRSFDLRPVIETAKIFAAAPESSPQFVFCGSGDMFDSYVSCAEGMDNVIMPGWIDSGQIQALLGMADLAIAPLPERPDFLATVNNKVVEYLSGGIPTLVSPRHSYAARLVDHHGCGTGFDLHRPYDTAELIRGLLADPQLLGLQRVRARQLYAQHFSAATIMPRWLRLVWAATRHRSCNFDTPSNEA